MEKRLLLAIALMVGLMVASNVLFPPTRVPVSSDSLGVGDSTGLVAADSGASARVGGDAAPPAADTGSPSRDSAGAEAAAFAEQLGEQEEGAGATSELEPAEGGASEIITVRSDLYEFRFDSRGARLVEAALLSYPNFEMDRAEDGPVQLIRDADALFGYAVATGADTVHLSDLVFSSSSGDITVGEDGDALTFELPLGGEGVTFEVTYRFSPTDYRIDVEGGLRGVDDQGYAVLFGLGRGLRMNEANPREDVRQMAVVTRGRAGAIASTGMGRLEPGAINPLDGGPFSWAASKSKYFLAAVVAPEDAPGIGGVLMEGVQEENAARTTLVVPVPAGSGGFRVIGYIGPQDHDRLQAIGQNLQSVNPFGWKFLQWFIRPFGELVIAVLVWMHGAFSLAYGWVLILFGVLARIVLFPLYQKSMRSQMKQMTIQPEMKKLQERYKDEPQKLQQEMMKLYKEAGVSPLGGCLPMLLPFPILITLFFVFQNTIEFRGVPFLWLPDLSLKDPLYIIPLLMGGSMLGLNWIGQRGIESNQQTKVITYVLPVVFTFMFAQFAAGLNLYYTASNIASLPQQLYLAKERRAHQAKPKPGAASGDSEKSAKRRGSARADRRRAGGGKTGGKGRPK